MAVPGVDVPVGILLSVGAICSVVVQSCCAYAATFGGIHLQTSSVATMHKTEEARCKENDTNTKAVLQNPLTMPVTTLVQGCVTLSH